MSKKGDFILFCGVSVRINKQTLHLVHLFASLDAERERHTCFYFFSDISELWLGRKKEKTEEKMSKIHKLLKRCFDLCLIFDFIPGFWRLWNRKVSQRYERLMQKDQGQKTEPGRVCVWGGGLLL